MAWHVLYFTSSFHEQGQEWDFSRVRWEADSDWLTQFMKINPVRFGQERRTGWEEMSRTLNSQMEGIVPSITHVFLTLVIIVIAGFSLGIKWCRSDSSLLSIWRHNLVFRPSPFSCVSERETQFHMFVKDYLNVLGLGKEPCLLSQYLIQTVICTCICSNPHISILCGFPAVKSSHNVSSEPCPRTKAAKNPHNFLLSSRGSIKDRYLLVTICACTPLSALLIARRDCMLHERC